MRTNPYRFLRAAQSYVPFARRAKFELYIRLTRYFGLKMEKDFRLLSRLDHVNLAIDIGGNWGQSIEALRWTCRPKKILCIEPNPHLSRMLRSRYQSDPSITILENALSDAPGDFQLFVPSYRGFVYDGLASLDEASASEWLNEERVAGFNRKRLTIEQYRVQVITLDSLNLDPDILKVDVQGYEMQVVKGGAETIKRRQPIIIMESPNSAIITLLAEQGLLAFGYRGGRLVEGETSQLNTVFLGDRDRTRLAPLIDRAPNFRTKVARSA